MWDFLPGRHLSLFFRKHHQEYYEGLNAVRRVGSWEGWIKFYLQGFYEISCPCLPLLPAEHSTPLPRPDKV